MPDRPSLFSRRAALLGLTSVITMGGPLGGARLAVAAAPTERRFVVVILRGAMDGMSAVVPYGDPGLVALRPGLVPAMPGQPKGLLDLGGMYGLHPALDRSHELYRANELLVVHAVAGGYRVRSHFEAQDYLECGADHRMTSGWLNRAVAAMGSAEGDGLSRAIAIGPSVPLLLRGSAGVANWAPHGFAEPDQAMYQAILNVNSTDPLTGPAIRSGLRDRGFGDQVMSNMAPMGSQPDGGMPGVNNGSSPGTPPLRMMAGGARPDGMAPAGVMPGQGTAGGGMTNGAMAPAETAPGETAPREMADGAANPARRTGARFAFPALAQAAGAMLRVPNGPRIAALEIGGWDTHTGQNNRLVQPLSQLDAGLDALKTSLGDAWKQTVVLVMTEFGRTARMNGTNGTDHGTATVAFVAGGAVAGGRVVANWPGLGSGQLFENRDLAPTTDLRSVAKGILVSHLGLSQTALSTVFPGGESAQPMRGLVRAA
jgi:uncharacterized protein (DUF1501 family)